MIQTKTMLKEVGFVPVECVAVKGSIEALPFWFGNNSRMTVKVKPVNILYRLYEYKKL